MPICLYFFFNDTSTTEIYTLSLHDALPISVALKDVTKVFADGTVAVDNLNLDVGDGDRKSTRLNSSHVNISYAVICSKTKRTHPTSPSTTPGIAVLGTGRGVDRLG